MKKKIRCPYFELNDQERAYHDTEHFFPKKTSWNGGHLVDFRFGRPQDHLDVCTDDIESRRRDRRGHAGGAGSPTGSH